MPRSFAPQPTREIRRRREALSVARVGIEKLLGRKAWEIVLAIAPAAFEYAHAEPGLDKTAGGDCAGKAGADNYRIEMQSVLSWRATVPAFP